MLIFYVSVVWWKEIYVFVCLGRVWLFVFKVRVGRYKRIYIIKFSLVKYFSTSRLVF